jgi:hypothetical protein
MAKSKDQLVTLKRGAAERIARQALRLERGPFNTPPQRAKPPVDVSGVLRPAQVGDGILAGDMSGGASGSATLCGPTEDNEGLEPGSVDITVYNHYTTAIPAGALVWVAKFASKWRIVGGNCGPSQ